MTVSPNVAARKTYPLWLRLVGLVCALLTAWHIFATFLWVAPKNELREAIPGNALSSYMLPMFGQSWSVFAPKPIDGDYSFEVRAVAIGDDGKKYTTEWVDAVDREMDMIQHNLFPARAALASNHVSSKYQTAWKKLNDGQQGTVEKNYFKGEDWNERLSTRLKNEATENSSSAKSQTASFIKLENQASAYATQVAKALWGDSVSSVQFKAGRQSVVPFEKRNDPDAERPARTSVESGWRGLTVEDGQNEENFAKIFNFLEAVN